MWPCSGLLALLQLMLVTGEIRSALLQSCLDFANRVSVYGCDNSIKEQASWKIEGNRLKGPNGRCLQIDGSKLLLKFCKPEDFPKQEWVLETLPNTVVSWNLHSLTVQLRFGMSLPG